MSNDGTAGTFIYNDGFETKSFKGLSLKIYLIDIEILIYTEGFCH